MQSVYYLGSVRHHLDIKIEQACHLTIKFITDTITTLLSNTMWQWYLINNYCRLMEYFIKFIPHCDWQTYMHVYRLKIVLSYNLLNVIIYNRFIPCNDFHEHAEWWTKLIWFQTILFVRYQENISHIHFHMQSRNGPCLIKHCSDDNIGNLNITRQSVTSSWWNGLVWFYPPSPIIYEISTQYCCTFQYWFNNISWMIHMNFLYTYVRVASLTLMSY